MASFDLDWRGKQVKARLERAARMGIDDTTSRAIDYAKPRTPVKTGTLQGSLMMRPAQTTGNTTFGLWGSFNVEYAIYQELGTARIPGKFFLQQGAVAEYPKLWSRIKARFAVG